MATVAFTINDKAVSVNVEADAPLLWVVREHLQLTGTEVRLRHGAVRRLHGASRRQGDPLLRDARQQRRRQEGDDHRGAVGQRRPSAAAGLGRRAGAAVRLLPVRPDHAGRRAARRNTNPTREAIVEHMNGNICRCGTYPRIVRAIERAAQEA